MHKLKINTFLFIILKITILTAISFAQTPTTIEGWYKLGYEQIGKKEYDAAAKSFSECIKLNPKADGCFRGRATALLLLNKNDQALTDAGQAIALNPKDDISYTIRGDVYKRQRKYQQAVADYSSAIGLKPSAVLYFTRGSAYASLKNYQAAIDDNTKAISLKPDFYNAYGNRGDVYFNLGKYELAIADFTKFIQSNPNNIAMAYVNRGRAFDRLDKDQEAIADYTKAISLDPKYAWAFNNRGFIYEKQDKFDLAIADYSKAISLDPNTAMFYRNRGNVFSTQEKYDSALVDLKKAIEIDPKFSWAYNNLGNVYYKQKNYAEALINFEKAIENSKSYAAAHFNKGLVFRDQENYAKAVESFSKTIEEDDKYIKAYKERGEAYKQLKKYDEALKDFTKLTELEPKNAGHWVDLGAIYDSLKQPEKNLEYNRKALELAPKQHIAYFNLGGYFYNKKDYKQAFENFDRSIQSNAKYANSFYGRSRANCKLGKTDLAKADEKKATELGYTIDKTCAEISGSVAEQLKKDTTPKAESDFDLAKKDIIAKKYADALSKAENIYRSTSLDSKTKGSQIFEIAQKLTNDKQIESAKKLFEKILTLKDLNPQDQLNSNYILGNIYFNEKNYAKAHEYYNKISDNLDARKNNIKVYYQEKNWKQAAALTVSTLEILVQNYYSSPTTNDKQKWSDATNQFLKDAWGLANDFAAKPEAKAEALLIYKAMAKVIPTESVDGKTLKTKITEMEAK